MESSFPTFFHINQRGEDGYRDLARLVAMSQPLTLWALSSLLLRSCDCGIPKSGTAPQMEGLSAMTGELARLLAELDLQGPPDLRRLRRFLRGSGHRDLVTWMSGICTEYEQHRPRDVDKVVFDRLKQELGRASFESFTQGPRRHPDDAGIGAIGAVAGVVGMATAGVGWVPALALGAAVYPVGKGLVRELGFIPAAFDGPQWPFLYTYGRAARKGQLESMRASIERMQATASQSKSATP
jgi:hypothetical protein